MATFGVEIECVIPTRINQTQIAAAMVAAGVPCFSAGYTHALSSQWKVVSDASVYASYQRDGSGQELVSPPLPMTSASFDQIRKVCEVLQALGGKVNKTCGLHVHHDARNHSVPALRKLAELYIKAEDAIDSLLPPSRRGSTNVYCRSIKATDMRALAQAATVRNIAAALPEGRNEYRARFVKLNFNAFWRHGTVEFRHHSGTLDANKIIQWVSFTGKLVDAAVKDAHQPIDTTEIGGQQIPVTAVRPALAYFNQPGRARAVIYTMLNRGHGTTMPELIDAIRRARLSPSWLNGITPDYLSGQIGVTLDVVGTRGGYTAYRLPGALAAPVQDTPEWTRSTVWIGRRGRQLLPLLLREQGVTREELRQVMRNRSLPDIRTTLRSAGAPIMTNGTRDGHEIYMLSLPTTGVTSNAPLTLEELYVKLELSETDKAFWRERHALLLSNSAADAA